MIDPIRRLLTEATNAKQTRAFWQVATGVLSDWAGGARVQLDYQGLNESGTALAGAPEQGGEPFIIDYHDAEGRHVRATLRGMPDGFPADVVRSALEIATHLAVMVARRGGRGDPVRATRRRGRDAAGVRSGRPAVPGRSGGVHRRRPRALRSGDGRSGGRGAGARDGGLEPAAAGSGRSPRPRPAGQPGR